MSTSPSENLVNIIIDFCDLQAGQRCEQLSKTKDVKLGYGIGYSGIGIF